MEFSLKPAVPATTPASAPSMSLASATSSPTSAPSTAPQETSFKADFSQEKDIGSLAQLGRSQSANFRGYKAEADSAEFLRALAAFLQEQDLPAEADFSLVYEDLSSGARYCYNEDRRYQSASVIKVAVAMVCAQLQAEGVLPADLEICYVPGEHFSSEDLVEEKLGQMQPLAELIAAALTYSSNADTSVIFEYFKRHGRDLHFFLDERCGTNYAKDITLSALEGIQLIEKLYDEQSSYPGYGRILELMQNNSWGAYLTAGIPVAVASKYGNIGNLQHEIGLVWSERPFAYAAFSAGIDALKIYPELGAFLYEWNQTH